MAGSLLRVQQGCGTRFRGAFERSRQGPRKRTAAPQEPPFVLPPPECTASRRRRTLPADADEIARDRQHLALVGRRAEVAFRLGLVRLRLGQAVAVVELGQLLALG